MHARSLGKRELVELMIEARQDPFQMLMRPNTHCSSRENTISYTYMLDPKFIRKNVERVKQAAQAKNVDVDIDQFLELDTRRRALESIINGKRAEQKTVSEDVRTASDANRKALVEEATELKEAIQAEESNLQTVRQQWHELLMQIPNVMSPHMPVGKDESQNVTIRTWGEVPAFDFEPKTHDVLGAQLNVIDTEKAAQVSGARFAYLKGDLVLMHVALLQFAFATLTNTNSIQSVIDTLGLSVSAKPFVPMLPPLMIQRDVQASIHRVYGDQTYRVEDEDLNLIASAEHTMAPYHMNETLSEEELPKRYIGYSSAFRREAGTYGKDMKGIFRNHQFEKSEMESFTTAETGEEEQQLIVGLQEYMLQQLDIPYRVQQICSGDAGKPDYQQIDIESWMPGQGAYRETHTSDYMTDYQTRGINAYYKTAQGERKLLHTNDATAFAGRSLIAIMENYQTAQGEIRVPTVLQRYMGGKESIGTLA